MERKDMDNFTKHDFLMKIAIVDRDIMVAESQIAHVGFGGLQV